MPSRRYLIPSAKQSRDATARLQPSFPLELSAAAEVLGVTRPTLSALLNERASLSLEMALRIEKAFGVSMDTLMRMQNSYEIARIRDRAGEITVAPFKGRAPSTMQRSPAGSA